MRGERAAAEDCEEGMIRDEEKQSYLAYRAAAQLMAKDLPGVSVPDHAPVQVTADRDGAFVEAILWVPKEKIEGEAL